MGELLFTPASVLDFLSQVDELKDVDVGVYQSSDDSVAISIGNTTYHVKGKNIEDIEVPESAVELVDEVNIGTYQELEESGEVDLNIQENVEGGVIKEFAKTLLVGGLVRLTTKFLK